MRWFEAGPGRALLEAEAGACGEELQDIIGTFGATFTVHPEGRTLIPELELSARHDFILDGGPGVLESPVRSRADELPIASESLRLVVLQHVLEAMADADAFLSECERVLAPGGALTVLGLNPLGRGLRWGADPPPWVRAWRTRMEVQRLLARCSLVLDRARPVLPRDSWLERLGRGREAAWPGALLSPVASAYLLVYRKPKHNGRVIPLGDPDRRARRAMAGATPTVGSLTLEREGRREQRRRAAG